MATAENHLIELLPDKDRKRPLTICEPVLLDAAASVFVAGCPSLHVYFPVDACVSLIATQEGHAGLGVGMVGREGMLGTHVALGIATAPFAAEVLATGSAWKIESRAFKREMIQSRALQRGLNRYIYVLMGQLATSAACVRFHSINARLAKWLLMSQDRVQSDKLLLTHEFLAGVLGVRREGITLAAGNLQRLGFIEYSRGDVTLLSRSGLEAAACNCYALDRTSYGDTLS